MSKRVFNWGWYGFENYGDDLLQNTMLEKLTNAGITVIFPMEKAYEELQAEQVSRSYKELFLQAKACDALIVGPGGLFPFTNLKKLLVFYAAVLYWKMKKRKVLFFGIGISKRIGDLSRLLWKRIISHSDLFFTRSEGFLNAVGVKETETVQTMADTAFASDMTVPCDDSDEKSVAVVVANLFKEEDVEPYQKSIAVWRKVCDALLHEGYNLDLIAFTKGKDDMLIRDIMKSIKLPDNIGGVQLVHYSEVSDAVAKWNHYEQVICMRFHSLVLSVLANVPALPVAYGHKTASLAEDCGLDEYLLYWNPAEKNYFGDLIPTDAQSIIGKFHTIERNSEQVRLNMGEARKRLMNSANAAVRVLVDNIR